MFDELLAFIAAGTGIKLEDLKAGKFDKASSEKFKLVASEAFAKLKSEDDFTAAVTAKTKAEGEVTTLKSEKVTLEGQVTALKAEKTTLETEKTGLASMAKVGTEVLTGVRTEAKRLYGIYSKNKPDAVIVKEIEDEQDLSKLDAKLKMWGGHASTEYGAYCGKCNSSDVKFRKSIPTGTDNPDDNKDDSFSLAETVHYNRK